ncbi:MAG: RNA polymerase sigma factor RpoH [Rhodospirillales bacterium]|jgi:RNA polymerase sigma-32 factor|nr:RNA polymerase sigma factor RpoH [Rhodospirillales bacterium]
MTTMTLPAVPTEEGLSRYFREIWRFPLLEPDEEYMLATRWRQHGDMDAAHRLVTSHLRLVAKIAVRYRGYGLPLSDLVSEGSVGLMKAVKKFEPERGFRLSTYAMWWIRAAITEYVLRSWSLVKMGTVSAQKKLFFALRRIKKQLGIMDRGELTPAEAEKLADALDVRATDVIAMNRRLAARDVSLNAPISAEPDDTVEYLDTLADDGPTPETFVAEREESVWRGGLLRDAMATLPERDRHILTRRRLTDEPETLEEIGRSYGISRERVRQLEARAFEKVKRAVHGARVDGAAD